MLLVIAYFGSYLALASKNVRPDNSFHVSYPLDIACCHYFYYPAHVIDTYARRDLWRGEFYITLLPPYHAPPTSAASIISAARGFRPLSCFSAGAMLGDKREIPCAADRCSARALPE